MADHNMTERARHVEDALRVIVRVVNEEGRPCLNTDEVERVNRLLDTLDPAEVLAILDRRALELEDGS